MTFNYVTSLPPTPRGFNSIGVAVDRDCTKGEKFMPTTNEVTATGMAELIHKNVYRRFRLPERMIMDRGPQFSSKVMVELCKRLGIDQAMSTAYHPQTDGQTEHVNQELELYLCIFAANNPMDWDLLLPDTEFTHNSRPHSMVKTSPFYAMMGYKPQAIPHITERTTNPETQEHIKQIQRAREEARYTMEAAQKVIKQRVKAKMPPFKKGQMIWLDGSNL